MARRARLRSSLGLLLASIALRGADQEPPRRIARGDYARVHTARGLTYVNGTPFSGTLVSLQPNGHDTLRVQAFRDGRAHGVLKQFYPDGKPELIRWFRAGKKEGPFKAWWANGRLRLAYAFHNGEYDGEGREWASNGRLIKRMHYAQGQEAGLQQQWTDRGDLWANYVVRRGRRYGITGVKSCATLWNSHEVPVR